MGFPVSIDQLFQRFPAFGKHLHEMGLANGIEAEQPPASRDEIQRLEADLSVALPQSYKDFLECTTGFRMMNGTVQFGGQHPFFHDFPAWEELTAQRRESIRAKGRTWPPPSQGMLCFAEFFMEADGDQVLFDISGGLRDGEYPVFYYSHEAEPPSVRRLADSFGDWLNGFLGYEEFSDYGEFDD